MRIHYDTEFLDRGPDHPLQLISIGMIAEDGRKLYAVNADMDQDAVTADPWLRKNVWLHLPLTTVQPGVRGLPTLDRDDPDVMHRAQIANAVLRFVRDTPNPELWAYYSAHDHVVLSQLWGRMIDAPLCIPHYTEDIRRVIDATPGYTYPTLHTPEHHAFADALNVKEACDHLLDPTDDAEHH